MSIDYYEYISVADNNNINNINNRKQEVCSTTFSDSKLCSIAISWSFCENHCSQNF
jgi:hypothetical protein